MKYLKLKLVKILWLTNSLFPEVYAKLNMKAPVTVGWVNSAAKALLKQNPSISLGVASFYKGKVFQEIEIDRITHYLIPEAIRATLHTDRDDHLWRTVKAKFSPDVVHIHGSEYLHSYAFVRACGAERVVVSIQGLVSVYERYYYGSIDFMELLKSTTIRDLLRLDTLFSQHRNMAERGNYEQLLIRKVGHVIGRTSWDRDHTWAINSDARYHFCNETLRPSFYKHRWSLENCDPCRIFVSQAHYPIKGLHQLIKALPFVLKHYPNTKVYVAGNNFFKNKGIRISGFGNYINKLIKKLDLEDKVVFTGLLSEQEMCEQFLKSNVFVCPSAIENSPNSVGEAQLLGVPCIASYVGGTADLVENGKSGLLYRFEEVEMLAANICRLFSDKNLAQKLSEEEKLVAMERHHEINNAIELGSIYSQIICQKSQ
ncbi:glycosyltransferase family 4 protein [Sunxiuqinia rutila]|uniref:glycosyltransferase family 4 protein n=1 Tax=Sunxiuqinia rutila TaxID=1397841 RepID=UPI003D364A68